MAAPSAKAAKPPTRNLGRESRTKAAARCILCRVGGRRGSSLVTAGMLFGAIDVGTNSIHLIVVECDSIYDTSRVVFKTREMVRLGSNDALERGRLSSKAMNRGVEAIARFV